MTQTSADNTSELPPYVIRCVELMAAGGDGHQHVVAIGTTDPDGGETRWRLDDVLSALRDDEQFMTAASAADPPAGTGGVADPWRHAIAYVRCDFEIRSRPRHGPAGQRMQRAAITGAFRCGSLIV
jgi:hypothetical protein